MNQETKTRRARLRSAAARALVGVVVLPALAGRVDARPPTGGSRSERLAQLVEAQIVGVHAFQVGLFRQSGQGDPRCWTTPLDDASLARLGDHQASLLGEDVAAVRAWAEGRESSFDPARDLEPLLGSGLALSDQLPVSVFTRHLAAQASGRPRVEVRSIAGLYQTVLEVERDGDRLQELYRFFIGLGLPVYVGQLGLPGTDADLLAVGRELEGRSCASPVGTSAAEWQIAGRKIWNWGEKNLHVRDARVLADELLAEGDLAALVPRLRSLPSRRVAVIGHSFTMDLHWSSPSAFAPIVAAMFARENPGVEFRMFQGGGLTASRAERRFYSDALAWKPDVVLFVVANRTAEDLAAFEKMGRGFAAQGATVYTFDDIREPEAGRPGDPDHDAVAARAAGMTIVEVGPLLAASPDRGRFVCLDGIHMTEAYHRLMAREWLKVLVGARAAALGS